MNNIKQMRWFTVSIFAIGTGFPCCWHLEGTSLYFKRKPY